METPKTIPIKCDRHKHGDLGERVIWVLCRWCTKEERRTVWHPFDKHTAEELDVADVGPPPQIERSPNAHN